MATFRRLGMFNALRGWPRTYRSHLVVLRLITYILNSTQLNSIANQTTEYTSYSMFMYI